MKRFIFAILVLALFILALIPKAEAKNIVEGWKQTGISSYYAPRFNGRLTANGERYNHQAMTAAHRTLPFGTKVQVTDKKTGKSITVRINDRGPFSGKRVLDLSGGAASKLGIIKQGLCNVEIKVLSTPSQKFKYPSKPGRVYVDETIQPKRPTFKNNRLDSIADLIAADFDINKLTVMN